MQEGTARAKQSQSRADELEERLIDFAVRIIRLCASLPRTTAGRHVAGQILRSGTSPAPNYGEARGAESSADFIHKLRIVLKELNESRSWLEQIVANGLFSREKMGALIAENQELRWIISASIKTARGSASPI